jgi:hypothetical protein
MYSVTPSDPGDPGEAMGPLGMTYSGGENPPFDSLYVGTTGDISLRSMSNENVILVGVPADFHVELQGRRVRQTGTTASDIVAFRNNSGNG